MLPNCSNCYYEMGGFCHLETGDVIEASKRNGYCENHCFKISNVTSEEKTTDNFISSSLETIPKLPIQITNEFLEDGNYIKIIINSTEEDLDQNIQTLLRTSRRVKRKITNFVDTRGDY